MPRRLLRLLLPAVLVGAVGGLLLFGSASADATKPHHSHGGTCPPQTVQDSTKAAMAVFTGQVTAVTRLDKPAGQAGATFTHTVTVTRVYQGRIDTQTVQVATDLTPQACSTGKLAVGTAYMFFVVGDGNPWTATSGAGTAPDSDQLTKQVERFLGPGRDPVPPTPEKASFTPLHPAAPARLSRAAAPGLALILAGLLGLLLVRGLGRRLR